MGACVCVSNLAVPEYRGDSRYGFHARARVPLEDIHESDTACNKDFCVTEMREPITDNLHLLRLKRCRLSMIGGGMRAPTTKTSPPSAPSSPRPGRVSSPTSPGSQSRSPPHNPRLEGGWKVTLSFCFEAWTDELPPISAQTAIPSHATT